MHAWMVVSVHALENEWILDCVLTILILVHPLCAYELCAITSMSKYTGRHPSSS